MKNIQICSKCNSKKISCVDTRRCKGYTRRRRMCLVCGNKFTTYEISEEDFKHIQELKDETNKDKTLLFEELDFWGD